MRSRFCAVLLLVAAAAFAGPRFGGRLGWYQGEQPRMGEDASNLAFGGQFVFPIMGMVDLEFSAGYTSQEDDITLENYLMNYLEEEEGIDFGGDVDSLMGYVEDEWGWSPSTDTLTQTYTNKFHDLDLGATLKVNLPLGGMPFKPYIGGGGGAHFIVSEADALIQLVNAQAGNSVDIDPYDHVHPGVHGVVGATFQPPMSPISVFAEYKLARALGDEAGSGGINSFAAGVNLGF